MILALFAACAAIGMSQAVSDESTLRAWLLTSAQSPTCEQLSHAVMTLDLEYPAQLNRAQLSELAKRVDGHPDHLDHAQFVMETRRASQGPDVIRQDLYWMAAGTWRLNRTYGPWADPAIRFIDTCVHPDRAWRLGPEQLTIIDPKAGYPSDRNFPALEDAIRRDLEAIIDGRLHFRGRTPLAKVSVRQAEWSATFAGDGLEFEYAGTAVQSPGETPRFEVARWKLLKHPDPAFVGEAEKYDDWRYDSTLQRYIAHQITFIAANGRVEHSTKVVATRPLSDEEFSSVSAIPVIGESEPLRGTPRITRVFDLRPGTLQVTFPTDPSRPPVQLPDLYQRTQLMQWIGWMSVVLLAGLLLWIRARTARVRNA